MKNTDSNDHSLTLSFETFKKFSFFEQNTMAQNQPSCFNGFVRFKKYKITIEEVEESDQVYAERLQKLWDDSDNHHDYEPLVKAAKSIGYKFTTPRGSNLVGKTVTHNTENNDNTEE